MQLMTIDVIEAMSSKEMSELTEKRHDSVKRTIDTLAENGTISKPHIVDGEKAANGVIEKVYMIGKRDSYVIVAQLSPEFTARIVDRWQALEAKAVAVIPNFANPAQAARAWAEQYEARLIAEATKAEIGTRREATAMNTASQAVKKANRLEIELDKSKQYASVKRMEMLYHGQSFNWRLLKSAANEMSIAPIDVFDANYGTVKAYHADVWREAYAVGIEAEALEA
jgi:phage regulator Rha-like protein